MENLFTRLLNGEKITCKTEHDTVELAQRLRRNGFDMDLVELNLKTFDICIVKAI